MSDVTRYPLSWPPGRPRTPKGERMPARFHTRQTIVHEGGWNSTRKQDVSLSEARKDLHSELRKLGIGVSEVIISSNLDLRNDGLPRSGQKQPEDGGVAVYFEYKGREMAFACDRWKRVEDNLMAIAKTIDALRGIERWGTGEMVEAAFTGFAALPAAVVTQRKWWEVFGLYRTDPYEKIMDRYRELAKEHHPDRNSGDQERMIELNAAYAEFKRERGGL